MKRIIAFVLILAICLSAIPVLADAVVNIDIGDNCNNITVGSINAIDGCNNTGINGVSVCGPISGPGVCSGDPKPIIVVSTWDVGCDRRPDDPRHVCLKETARSTWAYLESQLERIGWWYYGTHKFVWSSGTRIIYGRNGDNKNYNNRRAVTFYYKSNSDISKKAYLSVWISGKDFNYIFSDDFLRISKCDKWKVDYAKYYPDSIAITGIYTDGYAAVDDFIGQLQSLSNGEAANAEDYD